ncbi:phosphonate C-P lyase system protein PhnH [Roseospira goensis]|uniref:Alpha-D-ribose 1-methylphosphonate 5-triphosphate synthase subunit PhnH n=1 Tax=Roseospira goensis TaxID=391922 RepID=A0A7W6WL30_9PROT|nr:phosphonate C-P lyase system protein PhnH [Roseospira goensis]MBB4286996.1 alpha-D-ribose 1-methylphosphonate 5-triphosphate synthase subunit PhnH [Roseospira goensis]
MHDLADADAAAIPAPGLADPVHDTQRLFRAALDAMSRPGTVQPLPVPVAPPPPLVPWAGALALTLIDGDTPVWLDRVLDRPAVRTWLRFHCGCPLVDDPGAAAFALIGDAASLDDLTPFRLGPPEYPDRAATLIVQVAGLGTGPDGHRLSGPGIRDHARLSAVGLADGFWPALADNAALYPDGVDVVLAAPDGLAALPRSVMVED